MPSKASNPLCRSERFRFIGAILAFAGISLYQQVGAYELKTKFPRLGAYKISAPQNYGDPAVQSQLARADLVVVEFRPGWGGGPTAMRNAVKAIKAKNPKVIVLDYAILIQVHSTNSGVKPLRDKLDAQRWYLYLSGGGGTKVVNPKSPAFYITNTTNFVPADSSGYRWNTWFAKYHYDRVWGQVPELDGTSTDHFNTAPIATGDYNRDGKADSQNDATVQRWFREGMMSYANRLKALMPGKLVAGNIGRWGTPDAVTTEYDGRLHGGMLEHYIGQTWSAEGQDLNGVVRAGSWSGMMARYRKVMKAVGHPKLVIFNMLGKPNDYQAFRYGFASALMDNGYFDFSCGVCGSIFKPGIVWFDEFDLAGTANTSWLGEAIDGPQTSPWQKGVYRRRFQNGMVLVNPRKNGNQTVDVGSGYKRFLGKQDRVVNNGGDVTTVLLKDRDGLFLLKR